MSDVVIQVENLSKAYQIGQIGTGTISRDLERFWITKIRGKEDPFLKIGETNDRSVKGKSDIVWSLKDINFNIHQGDAVGIIGRNGAGKSTLLKLLSRVTSPTTGQIKVKGRIASLLEVGTGFHPELSGRENIYLNGAILGMRKQEITRKLDEIIDFSGVERYIDTPVKRYSSGMYVRLAFAVAAHLESEILIVDEVLAVGDAEFQKKCLGKMGDISKGEGRTILFVSHDLSAISTLTNKSILLNNGNIQIYDYTPKVISEYSLQYKGDHIFEQSPLVNKPSITKVELKTSEGGKIQSNGKSLVISLEINMPIDNYENIAPAIQIFDDMNKAVLLSYIFDIDTPICRQKGVNRISYEYTNIRLYKGSYYIKVHLANSKTREKFQEFECCSFEVEMINQKEPEWGWQNNVCKYIDEGKWTIDD
jgi:lipopolysaccharide transport system ATP-binding protein